MQRRRNSPMSSKLQRAAEPDSSRYREDSDKKQVCMLTEIVVTVGEGGLRKDDTST